MVRRGEVAVKKKNIAGISCGVRGKDLRNKGTDGEEKLRRGLRGTLF